MMCFFFSLKSFTDLQHKPQLVDLTVEEGQRLKVIYGSSVGFHVIDVDSGNPYDIYIPSHVSDGALRGAALPQPVTRCFLFLFHSELHNSDSNDGP